MPDVNSSIHSHLDRPRLQSGKIQNQPIDTGRGLVIVLITGTHDVLVQIN